MTKYLSTIVLVLISITGLAHNSARADAPVSIGCEESHIHFLTDDQCMLSRDSVNAENGRSIDFPTYVVTGHNDTLTYSLYFSQAPFKGTVLGADEPLFITLLDGKVIADKSLSAITSIPNLTYLSASSERQQCMIFMSNGPVSQIGYRYGLYGYVCMNHKPSALAQTALMSLFDRVKLDY